MNNSFRNSYHTVEWQELKSDIMRADNYTCQCCGRKGRFLNVHHLTYVNCEYNKCYTCDEDDLITLCEDCHRAIHGKADLISYDKATSKLKEWYRAALRFGQPRNYEEIMECVLSEGNRRYFKDFSIEEVDRLNIIPYMKEDSISLMRDNFRCFFLYNNRVTLKNRWLLWHDTETKLLSKYYVNIASKNKIPTFLPPSNPAYLVPPNPLFGQSIDVIFQEALNDPSIKKSWEQTKDIFKKYRLSKENPTPHNSEE
ncbi:MAG: hypothetical protein VZR53_20115 [Prevotella sp.]|nr:hypothetical protein [Prevotella sp.]